MDYKIIKKYLDKQKIKVILLLIMVFFIAGCSQKSELGNNPSDSAKETINEENKEETVASIPDNLISCDPAYFKRGTDGIAPDCDTFEEGKVCSYHTKEKNGETKIEPIQYKNACSACRFYGETGIREIGSAKFIHHGYLKEGCNGIIWEK